MCCPVAGAAALFASAPPVCQSRRGPEKQNAPPTCVAEGASDSNKQHGTRAIAPAPIDLVPDQLLGVVTDCRYFLPIVETW
jgi:hypothetical protein